MFLKLSGVDEIKSKELRIVSIIGARPQFIKAAMVSRAILHHTRENVDSKITEILVHTGQHYDHNMSQIFFDQMKIPLPEYNLEVGSGSHGEMTGAMLIKIENVLAKEYPDWVLVYGDTNSTLAGALAAAKLHIQVAHVEAGLRSYNRRMPEEINRILTDRISSILFCPSDLAVKNLKKEGIAHGVFKVGDVMYDAFLAYKNLALQKSNIISDLSIKPGNFCLSTLHRQENTDDPSRLIQIFSAFNELAQKECPFVIPLHPRTRKTIKNKRHNMVKNPHVRLISPLNYLDMIALESHARIIFTDSGGMQKEALFARIPCITLREETEWVETVEAGWNYLAGADTQTIIEAFNAVKNLELEVPPDFYGEGNASQLIVESLISNTSFGSKEGKYSSNKEMPNPEESQPGSKNQRTDN